MIRLCVVCGTTLESHSLTDLRDCALTDQTKHLTSLMRLPEAQEREALEGRLLRCREEDVTKEIR